MRNLIVAMLVCGLGLAPFTPAAACPGPKPAARACCDGCGCTQQVAISGCCCSPESPPPPPQAAPPPAPSGNDPAVLSGGPTSEGPESTPRPTVAAIPDSPDTRGLTPLFLLTGAFLS